MTNIDSIINETVNNTNSSIDKEGLLETIKANEYFNDKFFNRVIRKAIETQVDSIVEDLEQDQFTFDLDRCENICNSSDYLICVGTAGGWRGIRKTMPTVFSSFVKMKAFKLFYGSFDKIDIKFEQDEGELINIKFECMHHDGTNVYHLLPVRREQLNSVYDKIYEMGNEKDGYSNIIPSSLENYTLDSDLLFIKYLIKFSVLTEKQTQLISKNVPAHIFEKAMKSVEQIHI